MVPTDFLLYGGIEVIVWGFSRVGLLGMAADIGSLLSIAQYVTSCAELLEALSLCCQGLAIAIMVVVRLAVSV